MSTPSTSSPAWRRLRSRCPVAATLVLIAFFFCSFPLAAFAQPAGTVVVTVTDGSSDEPLPGATVVLTPNGIGAATDSDGVARLTGISVGEYTLVVRHVGYESVRRAVSVKGGDTIRQRVSLSPTTLGLGGVVVSALSPGLRPSASIDAQSVREIEADDTGRYLRSVPGVNAARRGPIGFDPNIRGLTETAVGVYVGGMRTFPAGPLRMDTPLSHVDPSSIASIEVVKGPYALTWGPGNMSAIRAVPRGDAPPPTPITGTLRTGYDTNTESVETSAFAMGRQGRISYSANGAWRTGADYETGAGRTIAGDFTSGEVSGHVGVQLSSTTTVDIRGGYQEQLNVDYPGRLLNANNFYTGMGQIDLSYAADTPGMGWALTDLDVQVHAQQTLHGMDNRGKPTYEAGEFPNGMARPPLRIGVDAEVQNLGGRVAASFRGGPWSVKVGGDVMYTYRNARRSVEAVMPNGMRMTPPFYTSDRVWPAVDIVQEGAFLNVERRLGRVDLSATGRLDVAQASPEAPSEVFLQNASLVRGTPVTESDLDRTFTMTSGALTATLPLSRTWSVSAGVGSVARTPQALELYSDRIPASRAQTSAEFQGNPFLDPERSTQADVWLEGTGEGWRLQASGFARRLSNYVTLTATDVDPLLPLSPPTVFGYVNGEATFYGVEMQGTVAPIEAVQIRASGSYLWGRDETLDEPALGVSPATATMGARWTLPTHSPAVQNLYVDGALTLAVEQDRVATTRGERTTDGYTQVEVQTGVQLYRRVELRVSVNNVFDIDYTNHLSASDPFAGTRIAEPGRVIALTASVGF